MSKLKVRAEQTENFSEADNLKSIIRSGIDRSEDPLFVPHLENFDLPTTEGFDGNTDLYPDILETLCGVADDSQAVEQYNGMLGVPIAFVNARQSAACQVQWNNNLASVYSNPGTVSGARWGSGTMISDDLFLTCGHLFDQTGGSWQRPRINGTTNIISPQEIARNMKLNFNFQVDPAGTLRAEQSFPILDLLEYRLNGIDMAVCRIGGNPGAIFGRATISITDAAPPDMICIIGHPAGQPKRVEAGPTTLISGNLIHYNDIDTLGGNSGSGILRASDGRLVGVHTNGGCTPASPADGGSNFGQRIRAVIDASPILQGLVRPSPVTTVIRDVQTVVSRDLLQTLTSRDQLQTLAFRDTQTLASRDLLQTLTFRDQPSPVTLKFRDDMKTPVLDKRPISDGKGFDVPGGFDPGPLRPEGPSARPFILSTPHHSNAWQEAMPGSGSELEELENALMQYEQAMIESEAELRQLDSEYRQLLQQYESYQQTNQQG